MKDLDLLYDHYKVSNSILHKVQYQREIYMRGLLVLEAINFIFLFKSSIVIDIIHGFLNSYNINIKSITDLVQVVQIVMWILISYFLVSYFQKNVYIERQYDYISSLEQEITKRSKIKYFNRESDNYSKEYPLFLDLVDKFYKIGIPLLFLIAYTIKIVSEVNEGQSGSCWICILKFILYSWTISLILSYWHKILKSVS